MKKKDKQNRPKLKRLIFLCVIVALVLFSIVVGIKLHNNNAGAGATACLSHTIK